MPQDQAVFTSFEGIITDPGQIIVVGVSPHSADLTGDAFAAFLGMPLLYHSGSYSWMVLSNATGVMTFETDAVIVEFYATVLSSATGSTVITAFDGSDVIVDGPVFVAPGTGWQLISLSGGMARIDVVNLDGTRMNGIDDFGFTPTGLPTPTPTATPTPPPAVEMTSGTVGTGGGTVSTGTTATSSDPVETSVTVPSGTAGGEVVIFEGPITETPPSGFSFLGQQVDITAPAGTVANPLVITFSLYAPGMAPSDIEIFRATVLVPACGAAGQPPEPCIETRAAQGAANVVIVVRTSTASPWNLPEPGLLLGVIYFIACVCRAKQYSVGG